MTGDSSGSPEPRSLPGLPDLDSRLGEIRWDRWEPVPTILCTGSRRGGIDLSDGSCRTCAFPGPLTSCFGSTWYTPPPTRRITRRSRIVDGVRPESVPAAVSPYWCHSHYAVRCPACDETHVFLLKSFAEDGEFTELRHFYRPPRTEGTLF